MVISHPICILKLAISDSFHILKTTRKFLPLPYSKWLQKVISFMYLFWWNRISCVIYQLKLKYLWRYAAHFLVNQFYYLYGTNYHFGMFEVHLGAFDPGKELFVCFAKRKRINEVRFQPLVPPLSLGAHSTHRHETFCNTSICLLKCLSP